MCANCELIQQSDLEYEKPLNSNRTIEMLLPSQLFTAKISNHIQEGKTVLYYIIIKDNVRGKISVLKSRYSDLKLLHK